MQARLDHADYSVLPANVGHHRRRVHLFRRAQARQLRAVPAGQRRHRPHRRFLRRVPDYDDRAGGRVRDFPEQRAGNHVHLRHEGLRREKKMKKLLSF